MSPLVIGLVAGLVVAAVVIFCCIRSVCKEKTAIERQVKQVHQVDEDPRYDDVEAPSPPSELNTRRAAVAAGTATTTTAFAAGAATKAPPAPATRAPAATASKAPAAATTAAEAPATAAAKVKAPAATAATASAKTRGGKPRPAAGRDAAPSYDELGSAAGGVEMEHVYGDDADVFQGRHEYQAPGDPYDAPVRVSRSTERRSGSLRTLSPEPESRTSSMSSTRGRVEVRTAAGAAAAAIRAS